MKVQLGVRINRIMYQQFLELCGREKLRPGEALEALISAAIRAGSVGVLSSDPGRLDARSLRLNKAVFTVRLREFEKRLEDRELMDAAGFPHGMMEELVESARGIDDEQLIARLEKILLDYSPWDPVEASSS